VLFRSLPFALTGAQRRASAEIARDLGTPRPMQRLLQGDVGAGKTVVAALAAALAIDASWQCALMAPTEILAEQHFSKLAAWLEPLLAPLGKRVAWLTGGQKKSQRAAQLAALENGEAALAVGTHAVIGEQVRFARLGLAVIDEQHRFGVQQRLELRRKLSAQASGQAREPHFLMMSATPIPRTLAMSYYADLDVSVIDALPPGRKPVLTKLVSETRRDEIIARIRDACGEGRQAYWVCPLIEESGDEMNPPPGPLPGGGGNGSSWAASARSGDKINRPFGSLSGGGEKAHAARRGMTQKLQLKTAIETFERLRAELPELNVGLVHGRLKSNEKTQVMDGFTSGQIQLLVATTVIEVGVDVPNASLMVIEHAERFGLSQLHQLRGRVGRGADDSVCILLYAHPLGETARARLKVIYESADGFEIARQDLHLRGPGEFLGSRQSGLPLLRFADLEADADLLDPARDTAQRMLRELPELADRHIDRWRGSRQELLKV
jgi:ATP-dependent DNA helicase RecG